MEILEFIHLIVYLNALNCPSPAACLYVHLLGSGPPKKKLGWQSNQYMLISGRR